jgi:hypothetical protein
MEMEMEMQMRYTDTKHKITDAAEYRKVMDVVRIRIRIGPGRLGYN